MSSVLAETLIAAKHLGIESSRITVSRKLEWVGRNGKLELRKVAIDRTGKITIFQDAIRAQDENIFEVLRDVYRLFNEEDHPRDEDGKFTFGGGGSDGEGDSGSAGVEFVSPNVASHLSFSEAVSAIKGDQQKSLKDASEFIDKSLGIVATHHDIIGAWADGAENSVASIIPTSKWDNLRVGAAMKGHLADQKSVLVFQQGAGDAVLYSFEAKGSLADIHKNLIEDGVGFHTLVPNKSGATVLVADLDGTAAASVEKGSARYDATVEVRTGQAEFIGTTKEDGTDREQRDSARAGYEAVIAESTVQGSQGVWDRVRDRWGAAEVSVLLPQGSFEETDAALKELGDKALDEKLTDDEMKAMNKYSVGNGFTLNRNLRKSAVVTDQIKNMDAALEKTSLKSSVTVFRGVGHELSAKIAESWEESKSASFVDKAFVSTTANKKHALTFSKHTIEIVIPKGAKAFAFAGGGEAELLIGRGQSFKVTSVKKTSAGWRRIKAELIAA